MPIPIEHARNILTELQGPRLANLFAQVNAKHVLHEVGEISSNFPSFDPDLDEKVTFAAYGLLAVGCSVIEQGDRPNGSSTLERAASLLQYVHGPLAPGSRESAFHVFVSAMAFYAGGQYSRAFVAIRTIEQHTPAARTIGAFLRKDTASLIDRLNEVLLRDPPSFEDQLDLEEWAITVAISRALGLALETTFSGSVDAMDLADAQLQDAAIIASTGSHPGWWWIVRLLRLMLRDLGEASPFNLGKAYFNKHEYARALEYFEQINKTNNVLNEDSYLYAGRCYHELNNKNEAENALKYAYHRYGSKKALDILISHNTGDTRIPINKVMSPYKKLDGIAFLSGYRGKFIVLGLFETSCSPCLLALDMLLRIEKIYSNDSRIAFINLFYENEETIVNRNITVNREAYYEIVKKLRISNVPWILFMDRNSNIIYEKFGIKDKEDNMKDIEYKISMLMER